MDKKFGVDAVLKMMSYMSSQSNLPWDQITYLGEGHSVPCNSMPSQDCPAVLLTTNPPNPPEIDTGTIHSERINLLWLIPVTENQWEDAIEIGSEKVLEKLWKGGRDYTFR